LLPNDEREQERLNFMHQLFRLVLDGDLCYTKLENPERILDLGTGSGIWALESK
jgi:methylase of polypeptide subunit release factors